VYEFKEAVHLEEKAGQSAARSTRFFLDLI